MLHAVLLAASLALGAQSPSSWVVLVRTDGSVPDSWTQNLQEATKSAAQETPGVTWVAPPKVSVEDAQIALGCAGWNEACAAQIASMMSADKVLVLDLEQRGAGAWLHTQVVDKSGATSRARARFELPDRGRDGLKAARVVAAAALTGKPVTVVTIRTDVPGAEVFIDGKRVGRTPLTLADQLAPGTHRMELRLENRAPVVKNVEVLAGEVTSVGAVLGASGPQPLQPTLGEGVVQRDPRPPAVGGASDPGLDPLFGYITLGVAGVVAAVGGGLYLGHVGVYLSALPRPCATAAELGSGTCESQAEAVARLKRDELQTQSTMNTLFTSFIVAEVVAVALAITGAGLVIAALMSEPDETKAPAPATP
jgi:hypothetical protein